MFKNGDKVLVKATVEKVTDDYVRIYAEGYGERSFSLDNAPVEHKTYSQGLADAWELAKKIVCHEEQGGMPVSWFGAIFDEYLTVEEVLASITAAEALAKIEAYEKEKEIKVGDVVRFEDETKALVVDEALENAVFVFTENGCVEKWDRTLLKKTGKHIDIESLLKKIGE